MVALPFPAPHGLLHIRRPVRVRASSFMRPQRQTDSAPNDSRWQWLLLLFWVFIEFVRPFDSFLKVLAPLRIAGLTSLALLFVFLLNKKRYLAEEPLGKLLIAFWLLASVSVLYAPNNRAAFNVANGLFWHYFAFVFPLCAVLSSRERVYKFFFFWVFVQTLLACFVATHHGTGPGGYLWDENDVALVLVMAIPYTIYLAQFPGIGKWAKLALRGALVVMLVGIGIGASRGAVVGLGVLTMVCILFSRRPLRNAVVVGSAVLIGLVALVKVLPPAYVEDMSGIGDPNDPTADERLWLWSLGWVMYQDHPVFGVGAGNYPWTNHLYATRSPLYTPRRKIMGGRPAHSIYFTLLPELGTTGLLIFAAVVRILYNRYSTIRDYCKSKKELSDDDKKFQLLFIAMLTSCAGYLAAGAFITVLYYPPFWYLVGFVAATFRVASRELPGFPRAVSRAPQDRQQGAAPRPA